MTLSSPGDFMDSADRLVSIFSGLREEIVIVVDLSSMKIEGANDKAQNLLGYDLQELSCLKLFDIIACFGTPDVTGREEELFSGRSYFSEFISSNSRKIPVSFSLNHVETGIKEYGVIIGREKPVGLETPGDTDFSLASFMKVLDSIKEAIVVVDRNMNIRLYNAPFRFLTEKFGYRNELIGASLHDAADFLTGKLSLEYKYVFKSGKRLDTSVKKKFSSRMLWYEVVKSPFIVDGEVTHVISVIRDITKQQELEEMKKESIFQIEKNMEQFAILNDHIRNPLQAIVGLADLDGGSNSEKIIENALQIDAIVKELDSGWIESDKIREMLLRHYGLKIKRRPNVSSPIGMLTVVGKERNEKPDND